MTGRQDSTSARTPRRALALVAALCVLAWSGGDEASGRHAPPAPASGDASGDPDDSADKVDARIWSAFARVRTQRVIVEVQDPHGQDFEEGCEESACSVDQARERRFVREEDLARRKDRVLSALWSPRVVYLYPSFRLLALEVDATEVAILQDHPEVVRVHFDEEDRPHLTTSVPFTRVSSLHSASPPGRGAGTAVAVLDTPVRYGNAAFGSCSAPGAPGCKVAVLQNFSSDDLALISSKSAHGTNVAGIVLGMAPDTKILSLNVFYWDAAKETVLSRSSDQIAALDWVAQNQSTYNIVAANLSIGGDRTSSAPCNTDSRYDAFRTLWSTHGVLAAVSSGNDGRANSLSSPSCLTSTVATAAQFDTQLGNWSSDTCTHNNPRAGEIVCFSNRNGALDLVAPGVRITAGNVGTYSGTSMAAPHVAGAIAAAQSYAKAVNGEFRSAYWMHRRLLLEATPLPTADYRYAQLDLQRDAGPRWQNAYAFPYWFRESGSANRLPGPTSWFSQTLEVSGASYDLAGAYLFLEVVHPNPAQVEVRVTSPSNASVTFRLPGGQANFNGVIGRTWLPGALAGLSGSSVGGTWTLSLRDLGNTGQGYYLSGTLFFVAGGCSPTCDSRACGDNRCGGDCGACVIGGVCHATGTRDPSNPCRSCLPSLSTTAWSNDDSLTCNDGNACTRDDVCRAGACVGTNPVVCEARSTCHEAGTCNPYTGRCSDPLRPDGSSCDDGNACTVADTCLAGVCQGQPVSCPPLSQCHETGTCEPETGQCTTPVKPAGSPCDDGDMCTRTDTCQAGTCVGADPVVCEPLSPCHEAGTCQPETGLCTTPVKPAGTPCDDGDLCTQVDVCLEGQCIGTEPVTCTARSACHVAGVCDPVTGLCNEPEKPTGAACDDGNACTRVDACAGGVCVGFDWVTCVPPDDCHESTCDPETGACRNHARPGGVECDDGDRCTRADRCVNGACVGEAIACEPGECRRAVGCVDGERVMEAVQDGTPCAQGQCRAGACVPIASASAPVSGCGCGAASGSGGVGLALALVAMLAARGRSAPRGHGAKRPERGDSRPRHGPQGNAPRAGETRVSARNKQVFRNTRSQRDPRRGAAEPLSRPPDDQD